MNDVFTKLDNLYEEYEIETSKSRIADLLGVPYNKAVADIKQRILEICNWYDLKINITGIEFTGSQRFGNPTEDSDVDLVFTYESIDERVREDDLFNILNDSEDPFVYEGFVLDINPIEDGDINSYIQKASKYRKR